MTSELAQAAAVGALVGAVVFGAPGASLLVGWAYARWAWRRSSSPEPAVDAPSRPLTDAEHATAKYLLGTVFPAPSTNQEEG